MSNERVVSGVKTRVLHGKDYVEVAERVNAVYKTSKELEIIESVPFQVGDRLVWRIVIKLDGKQYIGNAEVKLNAPKNTPDGTNPFECAETSALGRALAFAGLGTVERIASFDEVARSQPFTAIAEVPQNGIVEAGSAPTQIAQDSKSSRMPEAIKARLTAIYDRGLQFGGFQQGENKQESLSNFLMFVSETVGKPVAAIGEFTGEMMTEVEKYLDSKDMAQAS